MSRTTTVRLLTLFFLAVILVTASSAQQPGEENERPSAAEVKREWHLLGLSAPKHPLTVFNLRYLPQTLPDMELLSSQIERITEVANDLDSKLREFGQEEGLDGRVFDRESLHEVPYPNIHRVLMLSLNEKQAKELHELFSEARREVRDILVPHQLDQLVGNAINQEGLLALRYEEVTALLEFEPEQIQQVEEIVREGLLDLTTKSNPSADDFRLAFRVAEEHGVGLDLSKTPEEIEVIRQEVFAEMHVKFAEVLTEEQVKTLKRIVAATKEDSDDSK